mmetsp:Transcript_4727/g.11951  ORF Transcript_4727/g.11951 Transcript_4727/m.11951 type:complete len:86 (+) Transcript_4727:1155-1412(+)|eukprot:CAMPEP_0184385866 /NCGR_PEP_ID=MMETSP0007-20130409/9241_1 /TAXON_ID=97485 /ORGANISM="Prymnesium parvum, Strain Texoma1" /LENGTH=85 /DNA_ID=CAMNT_0026733439 /DNA_START=1213 /DNA_END=1470 /DNA_ORIENTATION=-
MRSPRPLGVVESLSDSIGLLERRLRLRLEPTPSSSDNDRANFSALTSKTSSSRTADLNGSAAGFVDCEDRLEQVGRAEGGASLAP